MILGIKFRHATLPTNRKSSWPFISGDSFLHIADFVILCDYSVEESRQIFVDAEKMAMHLGVILFVEVSYFEHEMNQTNFLLWIKSLELQVASQLTVIVHNGDKIPDIEFYENVSEQIGRMFSVNIVNEGQNLSSLPIGLENRSHRMNGVGRDFKVPADAVFQSNYKEGSRIRIVGSFKIETSFQERNRLKNLMATYGVPFTEPNLKPSQYRKLVKTSHFVLSPPGNGTDCHRTWEALYLGAIPVVLSRAIAPSLVEKFPILAVDKWEDFFQLQEIQLREILLSFEGKSFDALLMSHWEKEMRTTNDYGR